MNVTFVIRHLRENDSSDGIKDIHVGGKLIDSYYRGKKFSTHEKFTKGTSNKDTMFVKKDFHLDTI